MKWCAHAVEVEELALGTLSSDRAERARSHAAGCPECGLQLAQLRQERELFVRRARCAPATSMDMAGVLRQLAERGGAAHPSRERQAGRFAMVAGVLAAAACVLLAVQGWNAWPWSILSLRGESGVQAIADDEPSSQSPASCERAACNQSSVFASDCEPVTCWLPSASASKRAVVSCSQLTPLDWEGARCEQEPTGNP